jgi:hypothetical protein
MGHRLTAVLATGLVAVAAQAFAHHGAANYDTSTSVTIKGTVTEFVFTNPHTLVYLDVKDESGEIRKWQGELTSPNRLARAGWTKSTIKVGDQITIIGSPSKSGAPVLAIQRVLSANGLEIKTSEDN